MPARIIESLQEEILALHEEVAGLRRRDQALNDHMHLLDEELRLASRLQRDFLPKTLPEVGAVRFSVLFRPAGYVSGDIYDVCRLDETHVGFYLADAVGHGIPAALLTMFLKRALVTKEIFPGGYRLIPPGEAMGQLNQSFVDQGLAHTTFATALYGIIDTTSLQCTFARGGHPLPIILSADGELRCLHADGGLLGIFPDDVYTECTTQLRSGDRLIIYSDGVEVCLGEEADSEQTEWHRQLLKMYRLPAAEILETLAHHIDSNAGSLAPKDDLTVIVAEIQ
jgi:sigma-B regulation protein RsbU (phosphoserine phosphatase)